MAYTCHTNFGMEKYGNQLVFPICQKGKLSSTHFVYEFHRDCRTHFLEKSMRNAHCVSKAPNAFSICVAQWACTGSTNMRDKHMLICFSGTCKHKFRIIVVLSLSHSVFLARFRVATHFHCQTEFAEQRQNNDKNETEMRFLFGIFFCSFFF